MIIKKLLSASSSVKMHDVHALKLCSVPPEKNQPIDCLKLIFVSYIHQ